MNCPYKILNLLKSLSMRSLTFFICYLLFFWVNLINAELLILTHAYNKPEMIYWQNAGFKKFLKDEYKFVVFNDAPNAELSSQVQAICAELQLSCLDVPQVIHHYTAPYLPGIRNPLGDPSAECAETIQYMMDTIGFDYAGIVLVIDSDMFLIKETSLEEVLADHALAAHPQYKEGMSGCVTYLLPNLILCNMEKLEDKKTLNFNIGMIDGVRVDTGGYTHYYLQEHSQLKWLKIDCMLAPLNESYLDSVSLNFFKRHPKMFQLMTEMKYDYEFYMKYTFIHFRSGSNWSKMDSLNRSKKIAIFYEAMEELLEESYPCFE
jgi:hypothetical protein